MSDVQPIDFDTADYRSVLRRLAFVKVYPDACSYAVWLFNDQHQRPLGNAIFRWLLGEATALDDTRAVALMTKNAACGP